MLIRNQSKQKKRAIISSPGSTLHYHCHMKPFRVCQRVNHEVPMGPVPGPDLQIQVLPLPLTGQVTLGQLENSSVPVE